MLFALFSPVIVGMNWLETTYVWDRVVYRGDAAGRGGFQKAGPITLGFAVGFLLLISGPGGLLSALE